LAKKLFVNLLEKRHLNVADREIISETKIISQNPAQEETQYRQKFFVKKIWRYWAFSALPAI
jgi:hypothetical protein